MYLDSFKINGIPWIIEIVNPYDYALVDRTGVLKLATTDPNTLTIYLSSILKGEQLTTVLIHEMTHCMLYSYDLIPTIHQMVPREYWIDMEEYICNLFADYGLQIYKNVYKILQGR